MKYDHKAFFFMIVSYLASNSEVILGMFT